MELEAWATAAAVAAMVVALARGWLSPAAAVVATTAGLFAAGVIGASDALAGLADPAPVAIAGLYVVAGAAARSGLLESLTSRLLVDTGPRRAVARVAVPAAAASSVLANTPVVAMAVPALVRASDERGVSASRYLLPLSYATILGGSLTLVGTSTNLVAAGLVSSAGLDEWNLLAPLSIAGPVVLVCLGVLVVAAPRLLPDRRVPAGDDGAQREFAVVMVVRDDGELDGRTVREAGLRHLDGVYLVEIHRGGSVVAPVAPDRRLAGGDRLVFVGDVTRIVDLREMEGLDPDVDGGDLLDGGHLVEVVVGPGSPLLGRSLREVGFRGRHQAAVVAVHRAGERLGGKLGELRLRVGDTLALLAGPDFDPSGPDTRRDFALVTDLGPRRPPHVRRRDALAAVVALATVVVLPLSGATGVLRAVTVAVGILVVVGAILPRHVWEFVDLDVVAMVAAAIGLGRAVEVSGLGGVLASRLLEVTAGLGVWVTVALLVAVVMVLTELVTNVAAVTLVFPVALEVAGRTGLDPAVVVLGVAVAASMSFLTPIGYQTNTMVWGPGRYRLSDYLRLGLPLSAIVWSSTSTLVVALG